MTRIQPSTVFVGLAFVVLGILFLAELHAGLELAPMVLWPSLVIIWGISLLLGGLADRT